MKTLCTIIIIVQITLSLAVQGCTNPEGAREVLEGAGYTNVKITGWHPFSCSSEDDMFATGFEAVGPTGKPVQGTVCEGLIFKDSTIRLRR